MWFTWSLRYMCWEVWEEKAINRRLASFVLSWNNPRAGALCLMASRTQVGSEGAPAPTRGALSISAMAPNSVRTFRIDDRWLRTGKWALKLTGMSVPASAISARCVGSNACARSTCSMWWPAVSLVALCSADVRVPFKSREYFSRGAAIHDPIEGGTPVRQPNVEPSNKLELVPPSDLLLGALRLRGAKDGDDLTRLDRRRTLGPLQVHLVLCRYEAPYTDQQQEHR